MTSQAKDFLDPYTAAAECALLYTAVDNTHSFIHIQGTKISLLKQRLMASMPLSKQTTLEC